MQKYTRFHVWFGTFFQNPLTNVTKPDYKRIEQGSLPLILFAYIPGPSLLVEIQNIYAILFHM